MFLGLFGCLLQYGGIERAGRLTGAAMTHIANAQGEPCQLLSLNDAAGVHSFTVDKLQCSCIGFGHNKLKFVTHALGVARRARVVFLGHTNLAPIGQALRVASPRLRYWVATHGVEVWQPLKGLRIRALRRAEAVTAPSHFTAEQLVKVQGLDPDRVVLLPYCLEPGFTDRESAELPLQASQSGCILTVGRLLGSEPGKGVDTVLRALPKVLQAVPNAQYVIIGDGDLRPHLEQLAEKLGVSENVLFLGHRSEKDLKDYYLKADVCHAQPPGRIWHCLPGGDGLRQARYRCGIRGCARYCDQRTDGFSG